MSKDQSGMDLSGNIPALTGIRAFAAYAVFFFHFPLSANFAGGVFHALSLDGHVGVNIFFVLSGFLIAYRYSERVELTTPWLTRYFQNRFARIYPVYFLLALTTLVTLGEQNPFQWLVTLTLTQGLFDDLKHTGIGQAWTLTVEEMFYFSAPFIFLWLRKIPIWAPLVALYAIGLAMLGIGDQLDFYGFFANFKFIAVNTYFGRCFEFLAGIFAARQVLGWEASGRKSVRVKRTYLGLLGALGAYLALVLLQSDQYPQGVWHPAGRAINHFVLPAFVAVLFYGIATEESLVRKFLGTRVLVLLGKASYIFYLIHAGVISDLLGSYSSGYTLVRFAFLILCSILLYGVVERPMNRFFRELSFVRLRKAIGVAT